ncbi:SagB/ThcOx family dehydrogenase [Solirubrobacter phytolaccae]|uniref:SagB/ThcOx family dehydrogenase n=1 Tax=Solirubrobacter phytolaccae TaxID=1404360 RepID=A0A9X3NC62_9ACTN|nr:SagB/ThcOx family dehydrogenase [Solirubrobacter phytolaccae]MDA0183985.1 SagB/ThcOx family dehydrogenase [Solirubrobacter phytolaccae]
MTLPIDDTTTLSLLYHLNSEPWLNDAAYELEAGHAPLLDPGERPLVPLPAASDSALVALQRGRRSCREFRAAELPLATLASLLAGGQGVLEHTEHDSLRRATPSAGGLFPLEAHLFVHDVTGLAEGLYRYDALGHALLELDHEPVPPRLADALFAYPLITDANVVVVLVARFARTQDKYGPRGYRYLLLEAGHYAQNLCLRAFELGLQTLCIGGFADGRLNALLRVEPTVAGAVYVIAAGYEA